MCYMTLLIPSMFRTYLDVHVTKYLVLSGVNAQECEISYLCCALTSRVQVMGESCQNVRFPQSFLYRWPEQVEFYRVKLYIRRDIPWQLWQPKSAIKEAVFVTDIDWVPCFVRKFHVINTFSCSLEYSCLAQVGWGSLTVATTAGAKAYGSYRKHKGMHDLSSTDLLGLPFITSLSRIYAQHSLHRSLQKVAVLSHMQEKRHECISAQCVS